MAVSRSWAASARASLTVRTAWPSFMAGVPDRVPVAVGQLADVVAAPVQQQHVDVGLQRQLAPPVAAHGHQRHALRVGALDGDLDQLGQPAVDLGGPGVAQRAPDQRVVGGELGGVSGIVIAGGEGTTGLRRSRGERQPAGSHAGSQSVGVELPRADADDARSTGVTQIFPSPILPGAGGGSAMTSASRSTSPSSASTSMRTLGTKSIVYSAPGRPRCGRPGGRTPAPR